MKPTHLLIFDRPHGKNVAGKRSPDNTHIEYIWNNRVIERLSAKLKAAGYPVAFTVNDDYEPGLSIRQKRANALAKQAAEDGLIPLLISFHNNAASKVGWSKATGIEVYTTIGETKSDKYATYAYKILGKYFPTVKFRTDYSDGDPDKEANFTVLMGKYYSAILIEFLFQDSIIDIKLLNDEATMTCYVAAMYEFCVGVNNLQA